MLLLFSPIYLMFGLLFRSEQARLILALFQQVLILQRQLGKRPSLIPAVRLGVNASYVGRHLNLTLLAPDIVDAILAGGEPDGLQLATLFRLPMDWEGQRRHLGFPPEQGDFPAQGQPRSRRRNTSP